MLLGGSTVPNYLENRRWLIEVGRNGKGARTPVLTINTILGVVRACQRGMGVALLPDYLVEENGGLVQLFGESETIALDAYFVYPEELKTVARVQVFRDFLVSKAQPSPEASRTTRSTPRPPMISPSTCRRAITTR